MTLVVETDVVADGDEVLAAVSELPTKVGVGVGGV